MLQCSSHEIEVDLKFILERTKKKKEKECTMKESPIVHFNSTHATEVQFFFLL